MLSSGGDIQILRRNGPGKTTLVSGDFRLATPDRRRILPALLPRPHPALVGIITGFIRNFFSHFIAVDNGIRQF